MEIFKEVNSKEEALAEITKTLDWAWQRCAYLSGYFRSYPFDAKVLLKANRDLRKVNNDLSEIIYGGNHDENN